MSNIDKQALREAAEKATTGDWRRASTRFNGITSQAVYPLCGKEEILANTAEKRDAEFIAAANPATVLELLDELEHYKSREERVTRLVLDNSISWDELYKKLEAAEKRIAELESFISQSCYVFDGRDADISDSYIDASTSSLMPKVSTKNEGEQCRYCSDGSYSGLPGGACEHCMGTGLDNPAAGIGVKGE